MKGVAKIQIMIEAANFDDIIKKINNIQSSVDGATTSMSSLAKITFKEAGAAIAGAGNEIKSVVNSLNSVINKLTKNIESLNSALGKVPKDGEGKFHWDYFKNRKKQ
jgi:peptidoglycan hydrolase CwlO-like protein